MSRLDHVSVPVRHIDVEALSVRILVALAFAILSFCSGPEEQKGQAPHALGAVDDHHYREKCVDVAGMKSPM